MLRRYLCVRLSLKSAFAAILITVIVSVGLALFFISSNGGAHTSGPFQDDFVQRDVEGSTWRDKALRHGGVSGGRAVGDNVSPIILDDHIVYQRRDGWESDLYNASGYKEVKQVVSLLNMVKPPPSGKPVKKKVLNADIDLLHQAIVESGRRDRPRVNPEPTCVGQVHKGEVEDLLCIPRPKYLAHIKNPCWYDDRHHYRNRDEGTSSSRPLKCLPYFHILGCAKSGTTDLWNRMMSHPHIISNDGLLHKEALWWGWRRFGMYGYKKGVPMTFEEYKDQFQDTARLIQSSLKNNNHYHKVLITGDASPPDFWDFRGWHNISQNRGLKFPQVMTPHLMKHMYSKPKFILMFRDPIDRLYSDYFFSGGGLTSEDFHRDIITSISLLAACVRESGLETCMYDNTIYKQMPVRLSFACYSVFMREWLRVFTLDHFLFIKTEEYEADPEANLKRVLAFLDLHPLKETIIHEIADEERSRITLQKQVAGPMKNSTKAILSHLLSPCSRQLAEMTGQAKLVWES